MKPAYDYALVLVQAIMVRALRREALGEIVITRGEGGEHLRYSLTDKGREQIKLYRTAMEEELGCRLD